MIGVDVGSKAVKWFDGRRFGTGLPTADNFITGISSKSLLTSRETYPICGGSKLERIILNEISSKLSIDESELSISYCPVFKRGKACELLIFVERKSSISSLDENLRERSRIITSDVVGTVSAASLLAKDSTILDAGVSKLSVVMMAKGIPQRIEIVRTGFSSFINDEGLFKSEVLPLLAQRIMLIGGGALNEDFKSILSKNNIDFEIPTIEPFGKLTPLYFNAYGLQNFSSSPCKARFEESFILNSAIVRKNKKSIIAALSILGISLIVLTASGIAEFLSAKTDYQRSVKQFNKEVSSIIGSKTIIDPDIQVSQKLKSLTKLSDFLLMNKPNILRCVHYISNSVPERVKVLSLSANIKSETFIVKGKSFSNKNLYAFESKLRAFFKNVTSSIKHSNGKVIFTLKLNGVKGEL